MPGGVGVAVQAARFAGGLGVLATCIRAWAVYVQGHCLQEQRLYKRLHCLQVLDPLQEHTTFRESLVCYTSPPGGVYVLGVLPGVSIIQSAGCRGRSGRALPGPGRPAQSTGLGCPDSRATYARRLHI